MIVLIITFKRTYTVELWLLIVLLANIWLLGYGVGALLELSRCK